MEDAQPAVEEYEEQHHIEEHEEDPEEGDEDKEMKLDDENIEEYLYPLRLTPP